MPRRCHIKVAQVLCARWLRQRLLAHISRHYVVAKRQIDALDVDLARYVVLRQEAQLCVAHELVDVDANEALTLQLALLHVAVEVERVVLGGSVFRALHLAVLEIFRRARSHARALRVKYDTFNLALDVSLRVMHGRLSVLVWDATTIHHYTSQMP